MCCVASNSLIETFYTKFKFRVDGNEEFFFDMVAVVTTSLNHQTINETAVVLNCGINSKNTLLNVLIRRYFSMSLRGVAQIIIGCVIEIIMLKCMNVLAHADTHHLNGILNRVNSFF